MHGGAETARAAGRTDESAALLPRCVRCQRRLQRAPAGRLTDGDVVLAAITSCAHTANPAAMLTAGLSGAQRGAARPDGQALGQDDICARLACRRRIHCCGRSAAVPRCARLSDHRLRLHHLQRQLRPAARRAGRRGHRAATFRSSPSCRAIGTSRAASIRWCGPPILRRPLWLSPMRLRATFWHDLSREPLGIDRAGRERHAGGYLAVGRGDCGGRFAWSRPSNMPRSTRGAASAMRVGHSRAARSARAFPGMQASTFLSPSPITAPSASDVDVIDNIRPLAILGDGITTDALSPNGEILVGSPAANYPCRTRCRAERFRQLRRPPRQFRHRAAGHVCQSSP